MTLRPEKIEHKPSCPVAQEGFKLPTLPDSTIDTSAPSKCNCDFNKRLRESFLQL